MPIPKPIKDESRDKFIQRCMSDKVMNEEYDQAKRAGICNSQWENSEINESESKKIPVNGGNSSQKYCLVSSQDFERLSKHKWHDRGNGYVDTSIAQDGKVKHVYMHRMIFKNVSDHMVIDHINRNTYDNRRNNLKISNHSDNSKNRKDNYQNHKESCQIRDFVKFDKPIIKQEIKESVFLKELPQDRNFALLEKDEIQEIHSKLHAYTVCESMLKELKPENWQIELHRLIEVEMINNNMDHTPCNELDTLSSQLNLDDMTLLTTLMQKLNDLIIRKPLLSIVGESIKSGVFDTIDFNLNWPSWDTKFIDLIDKRIKEALPANMKYKLNIKPDDDGGIIEMLPVCDIALKVELGEAVKRKLGSFKKARENE